MGWLALFLIVGAPFVYALWLLARFVVPMMFRQKFVDIQASERSFFDWFSKDGVKRLLNTMIDAEGNLQNPICNFGPHLNGRTTIGIGDAEEFPELLKVDKFPKQELSYGIIQALLGQGLITSKGPLWKRQRRYLTPLFHFKNLTFMPTSITKRALEFCSKLKQLNGTPISPIHPFGALSLQIVVDCVFGGSDYLNADELAHIWEKLNSALNKYILSAILLGESINYWIPFPHNVSLRWNKRKLVCLIKDAIKKKKQAGLQSGKLSEDLLTSLLQVRDEITGEPIPEQQIIDEAVNFLFAGHDTISSLLSWTMAFLSRNPEVVHKIRDEVRAIVGDRIPVYEDVKNLKYCYMVLKEVLRMRPPVPFLDRQTAADSIICGKQIPANTYIYTVFIAAHYDNRYWKDPFTFEPERFADNTRHPYAFLPFSANTRNCIGQKFALMEAALILAIVVPRFDILSHTPPENDGWGFIGTMKPVDFKCSFSCVNK